MVDNRLKHSFITIILLITIIGGSIWSNAYLYLGPIIESILGEVKTQMNMDNAKKNGEFIIGEEPYRATDIEGNIIPTYAETAEHFMKLLPFDDDLVEINGLAAKTLNLREIYKDSSGVVLDNGYVAGIYPKTSTDYEINQITRLKAFLDNQHIQLLYVNEPTKYIDDEVIEKIFGVHTYINHNTDLFLKRLSENEINYVDFRDLMKQEGKDSFSYFYKTDHHWTVQAGMKAAKMIVESLNEDYGYQIDLSLYDEDQFKEILYNHAWLGEQGKKLGKTFVGLDDYRVIMPKYETSFKYIKDGSELVDSFEHVFINDRVYLPENNKDSYEAPSWHYSYMPYGLSGSIVKNLANAEGKKILVLGDSYEQVTTPFLALGVSEIHNIVMREYSGDLQKYIVDNDFDTVIVAYASFMIGAHDDKSSANYWMFSFNISKEEK